MAEGDFPHNSTVDITNQYGQGMNVGSHIVPKRIVKWKENSMKPLPAEIRAPIIIDFLKMKREERENGIDSQRYGRNSSGGRLSSSSMFYNMMKHKINKSVDQVSLSQSNSNYNRTKATSFNEYEDTIKHQREELHVARAKAKMLEENSKRKELMLKHGNSKNLVDDAFEANDMLIGAIESKLQILKSINEKD